MRTFLLSVFLLWPAAGLAAPLIQEIPAEGHWIKYQGTLTIGNQEQEMVYVLRAGGAEKRRGVNCRVLLMESFQKMPGGESPGMNFRLLIPEAEFGPGKNPLAAAVETWVTYPGEDPRQIEKIAEVDLPFSVSLDGPATEVRKLEDREKIGWQRGTLECDVTVGESSLKAGPVEIRISHRVMNHGEVPFRLAGATQDLTRTIGANRETGRLEIRVVDYGTGKE